MVKTFKVQWHLPDKIVCLVRIVPWFKITLLQKERVPGWMWLKCDWTWLKYSWLISIRMWLLSIEITSIDFNHNQSRSIIARIFRRGLCSDSWSLRLSSMGHFFFDIWFLKNHPHTCPSSWLSEKTPGCQEKHWYSLRAPRNRSDAHLFLLVQMHHTFLEQFTLFKQSSSWESCAGWPSYCKLQIEAIHGLIRFCTHSKISLHLSNFWMPYDLEKLSR